MVASNKYLLNKYLLWEKAVEISTLTRADFCILKHVLKRHQETWGYAVCSKRWMAEQTGMDASRIRVGLKKLVEAGLIRLVPNKKSRANSYTLIFDKTESISSTPEGARRAPLGGLETPPERANPHPQIPSKDSHLPDRDRIKFVSGEINENAEGSGRQVFERLGNGNKKPIPKANPEPTELDLDQLKKRARKMIDRDRSIQDEDLDYFYENIQDCPSREALFEFMRDEGYPFGQDGLEADPKKGFVEAIKKWGRGIDKKIAKMWIRYNVSKKRVPPTNAKQFYAWIGAYIRAVNQANLLAETGGVA